MLPQHCNKKTQNSAMAEEKSEAGKKLLTAKVAKKIREGCKENLKNQ